MSTEIYKTVGGRKRGFAVVLQNGAIAYDLLETRQEADAIRDVLNRGIGPDWDSVSAALSKRTVHVASEELKTNVQP